MMSATELFELATDIETNGLQQPIKLTSDGALLVDGRNREKACEIADVEPRYERLRPDQDVFAYIIGANLRRRHLTSAQQQDIIREYKRRNPNASNRQIAKLAHVDDKTVAAAIRSGAEPSAPETAKVVGTDGKSYPVAGKISAETRAAIVADLKNNPMAQQEVALRHGVSIGTVSGLKSRLREAGELPASPLTAKPAKPAPPPRLTLEQIAARRLAHSPRWEMTREERGMGSVDWGKQQAEGYPPGWTNDDAHVDKVGGRIQIYTLDQIAQQRLMKRFHKVLAGVGKAVQFVSSEEEYNPPIISNDTAPSVEDFNSLSQKDRNTLKVLLQRRAWFIRLVAGYLDKFDEGEVG